MTAESFTAIPAKLLDRVVAFVRRAMIKAEADSVHLFAVRQHGEERVATVPVDPESDPDEIARELAIALDENDGADRYRLSCTTRDEERATLTLAPPGRRATGAGALVAGKKGSPRAELLNGEARDYLLSAAINGYRDLVRLQITEAENRAAADRATIDRLVARNSDLEGFAMEVAAQHVALARADREGKQAERLAEVKVKALEDTAGQIQKAIPILTQGVAKWAGIGPKNGGGPPGAIADALRELGASQIVKLPSILTESQATAIVRAWEYVKAGGGEGGLDILVSVKAALRDLTAEQIDALRAILTPKQQAAVVAAYSDAMKGG